MDEVADSILDDALKYLRGLIPPGQDDQPQYRDVKARRGAA